MRSICFAIMGLFISLSSFAQTNKTVVDTLKDESAFTDTLSYDSCAVSKAAFRDSISAVCKLIDGDRWMINATSASVKDKRYRVLDPAKNFLKVTDYQAIFQYSVPSKRNPYNKRVSRKQLFQVSGTTDPQRISRINKKISKKGRVLLRLDLAGKTDHYHISINPVTRRAVVTLRGAGVTIWGKLSAVK
jgi:hypothetical protein